MRLEQKIVDPEIIELFQFYGFAVKFKVLPNAGGIEDQDAVLIDYFGIILNQENIEREKKMRDAESRRK